MTWLEEFHESACDVVFSRQLQRFLLTGFIIHCIPLHMHTTQAQVIFLMNAARHALNLQEIKHCEPALITSRSDDLLIFNSWAGFSLHVSFTIQT